MNPLVKNVWICQRTLTIQRFDGTTETVEPGDEVPEAATWPNRWCYEDMGYIKLVQRLAEIPEPSALSEEHTKKSVEYADASEGKEAAEASEENAELAELESGESETPEILEPAQPVEVRTYRRRSPLSRRKG